MPRFSLFPQQQQQQQMQQQVHSEIAAPAPGVRASLPSSRPITAAPPSAAHTPAAASPQPAAATPADPPPPFKHPSALGAPLPSSRPLAAPPPSAARTPAAAPPPTAARTPAAAPQPWPLARTPGVISGSSLPSCSADGAILGAGADECAILGADDCAILGAGAGDCTRGSTGTGATGRGVNQKGGPASRSSHVGPLSLGAGLLTPAQRASLGLGPSGRNFGRDRKSVV